MIAMMIRYLESESVKVENLRQQYRVLKTGSPKRDLEKILKKITLFMISASRKLQRDI